MNNQENQEYSERFYLEHFLDRLQFEYSGLTRGEDPPDFYIVTQKSRITVEITEHHSIRPNPDGRPWRMVEEERDRIRRILNDKVSLCKDLKGIHAHIVPKGLSLPSREEYKPFVDEIIHYVKSQIEALQSQRITCKKFSSEYCLLNKYVSRLTAKKVRAIMFWDISQAAGVGVSEKELINTIEPKLGKIRPSDIKENWLLIVSGTRLSQSMGHHHHDHFNDFTQLNGMLKSSPFDQIYIYDYMLSRILGWNLNDGWKELKGVIFARGKEVWDE